jgi:hypothetical protein
MALPEIAWHENKRSKNNPLSFDKLRMTAWGKRFLFWVREAAARRLTLAGGMAL